MLQGFGAFDLMDSPLSSLPEFDYSFKLLIIGDSGVGKSGLLLRFTLDSFEESAPTIAGQERFRTLTSSYYRGAQGIIMVYDVTRKGTFTNLADVWAKEIDLYSTNRDCIKMLVGNKIDKESARDVTMKEGIDFAREYGCLFLECSVKTGDNVKRCFEEVVSKILDTPSLCADCSGSKQIILWQKPAQDDASTSSCC